ncbi:unnamed protein product [Calicophoron daubneyi]|uniref:Uncharacterized protein n=1 Tax=Calicophoron daubneyi TaxID=300641 RepID=A0AAV2TSD2_CALDB
MEVHLICLLPGPLFILPLTCCRFYFLSKMPSRPNRQKRKSLAVDDAVNKKAPKPDCSFRALNEQYEHKLKAIERAFYLHCSEDFLKFYEFCRQLSPTSPLDCLHDVLGLRLVGPYELLHSSCLDSQETGKFSQCYRFFHDPPELVTVMVGENHYHLGYFRDKPGDRPSLIVSSEPMQTGSLTILGTDLFSVVRSLLMRDAPSSVILSKLNEFTNSHGIKLNPLTGAAKAGRKGRVCLTLNGVGLVIDLAEGGVGYRPLAVSYGKLKSDLQAVVAAPNEDVRLSKMEAIDELVTYAQFACDEGDYGQSLDLGLSLLAFHPQKLPIEKASVLNKSIQQLLTVGYDLAKRSEFAEVARRHMENRVISPMKLEF